MYVICVVHLNYIFDYVKFVHPYMRSLLFYAALPSRYERHGELHIWCWTHDTPHLKNRKKLYETLLQVSPRQGMNS
jgi:hypothetical protein